MSNLINNIIPTEKAATSNASTSTTEQTVKDKPSLFDSLLSAGTTTEETKVNSDVKQEIKDIKQDTTTEQKSEETKSDEITVDKLNKEEIESPEIVDSKEEKTTGTSSLLDRLILEAKNSAKEVVSAEQVGNASVSQDTKVDTETIEVKTQEISATNSEEEKIVDKSNIKQSDITNEVDNKEQKETKASSLFDNLVLEGKNNKELITKVEVSDLNKNIDSNIDVTSEPKLEEVVSEIKSEVIKVDDKNDISKLIEKNDVKTENDITLENKETKTAIDILKDIVTQKDTITTSSLENSPIMSKNVSVDIEEVVTADKTQLSDNSKSIDLVNNQSSTEKIIENTNVEELEKVDIKKDVKLSLMDQLIQKNSEKLTLDSIDGVDENLNTPLKDVVVKDLISNIYLGSQKNKITNQNLFNKSEAISLLKEGNSIQSVKTSAEMLDLGLESVNIEQDIGLDNLDIKKSNVDLLNRKNLIDNLLVKNDIRGEEVKDLITKSIEASNALIDNTLTVADDTTVNVNSPLSYNIQSRIIGAKQQMSAMMSDIAKQMYENYKPPVTAFKINLNPLDLGSIAILMKNDKHNGLTISMNVSNNVTLETLIENQNVLRNSLNKTFDENTKFNLDFSSSSQNSSSNSNQSSNSGQGNNRQFEQQMDTKSILELQEENKDREEKVIDYM
ncbi:MAG: flagellar hook-length control protein FliK [Aliarcobacter sp.]|nr:flagellar hook-length control protein FliK [Aliarcobacter sp.]